MFKIASEILLLTVMAIAFVGVLITAFTCRESRKKHYILSVIIGGANAIGCTMFAYFLAFSWCVHHVERIKIALLVGAILSFFCIIATVIALKKNDGRYWIVTVATAVSTAILFFTLGMLPFGVFLL